MNHVNPQSQQDPMDEFEQSLTRSLRRVDVRAETTAKFLAIADAVPPARLQSRTHTGGFFAFLAQSNAWFGGAVAAMLVFACTIGGVHVHHERQQVAATRNFDTALQIEDRTLAQTLAQTRERLQAAGISLDQ